MYTSRHCEGIMFVKACDFSLFKLSIISNTVTCTLCLIAEWHYPLNSIYMYTDWMLCYTTNISTVLISEYRCWITQAWNWSKLTNESMCSTTVHNTVHVGLATYLISNVRSRLDTVAPVLTPFDTMLPIITFVYSN